MKSTIKKIFTALKSKIKAGGHNFWIDIESIREGTVHRVGVSHPDLVVDIVCQHQKEDLTVCGARRTVYVGDAHAICKCKEHSNRKEGK
jgi:hypothetical protein